MTEPPPQPAWQWKDPTENVKSDIAASDRRQDDLRELTAAHLRELMARDREHAKEIRQLESERLNAILAATAGNVQRAAEVQLAQQQALAAQVAAASETNRQQATATAATVAETLRTTVAPMLTRLDELSRAQYEQQGQRQQVTETREVGGASRQNVGAWVGGIVGILGLLLAFYLATRK